MRIYLKNNSAKFTPDPICNDGALKMVTPKKTNNNSKMSSDMGSVPDPKIMIIGLDLFCWSCWKYHPAPVRFIADKSFAWLSTILFHVLQDAVLSHGEPRDAAENFDTYRILPLHRAVSLPLHDFLVTIQMLKLHTVRWFSRLAAKPKIRPRPKSKSHVKVTVIMNTWLSYSANKIFST